MLEFLNEVDAFVWGPPLLCLLVGTGIWLTIRLNMIQVLRLPLALKLIFKAKNEGHGDVDSFKALCTALAATVGTGNIVGVATAIKAGGPGALFWMWMAAFFGMATKYAEGVLAVKYRTIDANGHIGGGPMYYIEKGLGRQYRPLAIFFAVAGTICACFGSGTFTQVNAIVEITNAGAQIPVLYTSIALTVLVAVITLGGLKSIAVVADKIVPFMAALYVITTMAILFMFRDALPGAIAMVLHDAFTGTAATGGFLGATMMYYIEKGLGRQYRPLAIFFAVAGTICACFGSGTFTQVNAIVEITNAGAQIPVLYTSIALTVLVAVITLGGLKSIAVVADKIVPFMAALYVITTMAILFMFRDALPGAIAMVLHDAFTGTAATGGFLGATMMFAMRNGIARGLFSNESGLGSAPIVAAAAKTKWPAEQGLISMTGTFIDTIIICTMTGLTIIVSGVWSGDLNGAAMTQSAFTMVFPVLGNMLLMIGLVLFAFTTILGWNYYGERCIAYLLGVKAIIPYRLFFIAMVACGAFLKLEMIWIIADIANGLMALPNLIALLLLTGVIVKETKLYFKHLDENKDYLK